jgi:hypothetical protein
MSLVPILLGCALLVLAVAFGLHCLVLHCDQKHLPTERPFDHQSPFRHA